MNFDTSENGAGVPLFCAGRPPRLLKECLRKWAPPPLGRVLEENREGPLLNRCWGIDAHYSIR